MAASPRTEVGKWEFFPQTGDVSAFFGAFRGDLGNLEDGQNYWKEMHFPLINFDHFGMEVPRRNFDDFDVDQNYVEETEGAPFSLRLFRRLFLRAFLRSHFVVRKVFLIGGRRCCLKWLLLGAKP